MAMAVLIKMAALQRFLRAKGFEKVRRDRGSHGHWSNGRGQNVVLYHVNDLHAYVTTHQLDVVERNTGYTAQDILEFLGRR